MRTDGGNSERTDGDRGALEELYQEYLECLEIDRLKQEEEDSFFLRHYGIDQDAQKSP